ncbi:MAG TPA: NAD-dependent epimerase/dehydratase family protein [Acidimicrobiales bacterium]
MRVLVTGASGFIGSHTVAALLGAGHDVRVLVRSPERAERSLGPSWPAVEVATGDVTDPVSVGAAMAGCDAVVHAAGEIGVDGGSGPGSATVNVDGLRVVVEAGLAAGVDPIVYTSTVTAYLPSDEPRLTSRSPLADPLSAYGASKLEAELLVRAWQAEGVPITSFVIGGVYGPGSPHRDGSFAAVLGALQLMMLVPPGGMGVIDVRDVALLLERAVAPGRGPRHFMAGGSFVLWSAWTDLLGEAAGQTVVRKEITAADMIDLGRQFDRQRAEGNDMPGPLSEESAVVMTSGVPTDDGPTLAALGVRYRSTLQTFRDLVAYLRSTGELPPAP